MNRDRDRPRPVASADPANRMIAVRAYRKPENDPAMRHRVLTVLIIVGFWILHYTGNTLYTVLSHAPNMMKALLPRALVSLSGVAICIVFATILNSLRREPMRVRAATAFVLALGGTAAQSLFTHFAYLPYVQMESTGWVEYALDFEIRFWFFASICSLILALSYVADVADREERIRALQALAHSAQLRALRYQLNPHFLFNALNSIAGLIGGKPYHDAETMTENLADFLRTTLALDPQAFVTIEQEVRLQELYLEIEKVRFPDRLRVTTDVPAELRTAQIPALITQPLVENSIKYAVARSSSPVEVRISARQHNGSIELIIEDDGGDAQSGPAKGAQLGIGNVTERLKAIYSGAASLEAHAKPTGGFLNTIIFPARAPS
jgi:hypothetical protein